MTMSSRELGIAVRKRAVELGIDVAPPKPFLKWTGGKRQLLGELTKYVPDEFGTYYEPFVGGGALFFHLMETRAVLGDANKRLVRTYRGVRDYVEQVIKRLSLLPYCPKRFASVRGENPEGLTEAEVAAWLIYLNKTCYNGLYRVNKKGQFNVPFGRYENPTICDTENLRACSRALRNTSLVVGDFEETVAGALPGDFVYFDPPYVPLSKTSNFVAYDKTGFTKDDHVRLRDCALRLKQRGVHVLLSNSSAPFVRELYEKDFELIEVGARRAVNSKAERRGEVKEYIIRCLA